MRFISDESKDNLIYDLPEILHFPPRVTQQGGRSEHGF
jgi:hypothetical protein